MVWEAVIFLELFLNRLAGGRKFVNFLWNVLQPIFLWLKSAQKYASCNKWRGRSSLIISWCYNSKKIAESSLDTVCLGGGVGWQNKRRKINCWRGRGGGRDLRIIHKTTFFTASLYNFIGLLFELLIYMYLIVSVVRVIRNFMKIARCLFLPASHFSFFQTPTYSHVENFTLFSIELPKKCRVGLRIRIYTTEALQALFTWGKVISGKGYNICKWEGCDIQSGSFINSKVEKTCINWKKDQSWASQIVFEVLKMPI